jgi:glycine/D-amino acid oxidase-like deaminating enzyme
MEDSQMFTKSENISLWIATTPKTHYPFLPKNMQADVVVAGGGIAGISTAILLKQKGLKVILIESGRIIEKTTGNTTAKLTALHGLKYKILLDSFSSEGVKMYADANQAAIACVESLVKQYSIDCDCLTASAYTYAVAEADRKLIEDEVDAAKSVGLPAEYTINVPLPYKTYGAIKLTSQMQFHVRKYLLGLAKEVEGDGSCLFEQTKALNVVKEKDNKYTIITDKGTIKTTYLISATHKPFYDPDNFYNSMEVIRDYALGVLLDEPTPQGMYYSTGDDPYSIRYQPTSEDDIVVIGGGWEPEMGAKDPEKKFAGNLKRYSEKFKIKSVKYRWYTHDYVTKDYAPYVGKLCEKLDNLYVITGFAGWGMSTGTAAGMILSDLIVTGKNQWSSFFDPFERKRYAR